MIDIFKKKYGSLSDSMISKIFFCLQLVNKEEKKCLIINISCYNFEVGNYEDVELSFSDIVSLKFVENEFFSNLSPKEVFIEIQNDIFTFDFNPIEFLDRVEENPDSAFKIVAKSFRFTSVE